MIKSVGIYRDGGSLELKGADEFGDYVIWLDTPFKGEPRGLKYNGVKVSAGDRFSRIILSHLNLWFSQLSATDKNEIAMADADKHDNEKWRAHEKRPIDLHRINEFRDYVIEHYEKGLNH